MDHRQAKRTKRLRTACYQLRNVATSTVGAPSFRVSLSSTSSVRGADWVSRGNGPGSCDENRGLQNLDAEWLSQHKQIIVARHDYFCAAGQRACQENIIGGVTAALLAEWHRLNVNRLLVNPTKQRTPIQAVKFPRLARQFFGGGFIFSQNFPCHGQLKSPPRQQNKTTPRQAGLGNGCRDKNIRVENDRHLRRRFSERYLRITC